MAHQSTPRAARSLSARLRSALPAVVPPDAPDGEGGRRDRVVDASMYLVALLISTASLADTWELRLPPWLRPVAVAAVIATVGSLRWRRTHPGAVGIGVGAVSVRADHRSLRRPLQRSDPGSWSRPGHHGGPHDRVELHEPAPLSRPPEPRARVRRRPRVDGRRARLGALRARAPAARALAARAGRARRRRGARGRAAADRARDARFARTPAVPALRPRRRARVQLRRAGRGGGRGGRGDPRERSGRARGAQRRDRRPARGHRREPDAAPAADAHRPPRAHRGVARGRDADHRGHRARRRPAGHRRRPHRVPDRPGGTDQRAQARARSGRDAHRPRAPRQPRGRGPQSRAGGRRLGTAAARSRDPPDRARRAGHARRRRARARRRSRRRLRLLRARMPR